MKSQSIDQYVFFGTAVRFLQDVKEGSQIHGDSWIIGNIESYFNYLKMLGLTVTERASYDLQKYLIELKKLPVDARLTEEQSTNLSAKITKIRDTLFAELGGVEAFVTTSKRLDIQKLIKDISSLLSQGCYSKLSDIARYDLTEAGMCIAFERPTAAAFHLMRATEDVLKSFYCTLVKHKRVSLMWGPMISDLKNKNKAKKHETLLNHLDNIRLSFRNPTQHPDKIYDIQEVQDLWGLCSDAINRMAQVL
ncbi:MAG: hypothetical protein K8R85_00400 [Bacteroidetes bacterium]|nr:hypothetical protein [Bacteroidota bacterium]